MISAVEIAAYEATPRGHLDSLQEPDAFWVEMGAAIGEIRKATG